MKRKSSRYQAIPFSARLVGPVEDGHPDLFRLPSVSGQSVARARKIFVIKQTRRLPATNAAAGKKMQRILIFDNHPDSLRLVCRAGAKSHGDLSVLQPVSSWELILVSILTMGALIGMFWPLF
jgi:hypothetical protein